MASISKMLAIGIQHHQAGRLQDAEQIYRQILTVQPEHADALHLLGVIAHQMGQHKAAIEYIARAIRLQGDAPRFHNNLGEAYRALRRFPEAVASYRRAIKLEPKNAGAHYNLGLALQNQGKLDKAAPCYRRALELKPDYADAHNNLGMVLKEQGKLDEAIACHRRALKLKPDYVAARNNLGIALREQGKLDEAIACYRRALELDPGRAEPHLNLGDALKQQGKTQEAIAEYGRALKLKPDYAEAHNNLGVLLREEGKLDEAIARYRRALELRPDFAKTHTNLGNALKDQGKLDEAVACYRRALELRADYADAHDSLGSVLKQQGKLDEAIACYRRALELRPDFAPTQTNLGNALKDQGKLDEAIACYRRALALKPDFAEVHNNLGIAFKDQGKLDEAVACCRRAVELKPDHAGVHYGLGLVLHKQGKLGEAIACYRRAMELKPDDASARKALGLALMQQWQPTIVAQPVLDLSSAALQDRPQNMPFQTADFFETTPDEAGEVVAGPPPPPVNLGVGTAFMDRMGTIHAYLHHKLAPSARESHASTAGDGRTSIDDREVFIELQSDPNFADFINEMPRLLADAALAMYGALAPTLPAATGDDRVASPDQEEAREVKRFLHMLCRQAVAAVKGIHSSGNRPTLDLEHCCHRYVIQSAATALYLDFLHRRYPALLLPLSPDDDRAFDAVAHGFECLLASLNEVQNRLEVAKPVPDTHLTENFCRLSSTLLDQLSEFTRWLAIMMHAGSDFDLPEVALRELEKIRPSPECRRWLRATIIICRGEGRRIDSIATGSTESSPNASHGIATFQVTYWDDGQGGFERARGRGCWRHAPRGEPVPTRTLFISPIRVLGKAHRLSLIMEQVALSGDYSHASAVKLQRRTDWLETAEGNNVPLRTILYTNDVSGREVVFNLFSKPEADRLALRCRLIPMIGKHQEVYTALRAIEYELPKAPGGGPLPPSQLLMEMLDEDDDRRRRR